MVIIRIMNKNSRQEQHDFYCVNCGNKGIPATRFTCHKHSSMHHKKLYCIHCRMTMNHVEISNRFEYEQFVEDFNKGLYKNEVESHIKYLMKEESK